MSNDMFNKKKNMIRKIRDPLVLCRETTNISIINGIYKSVLHDLELLKETEFISSTEYDTEFNSLKNMYIDKALKCTGYDD